MPTRWYAWAAGVPEPTVAGALAAAAVLRSDVPDVESAAEDIFHRRRGGALIPLQHVPAPGSKWGYRLSPDEAAEAFDRACQREPEGARGRTSAGVALPVALAASQRFPADWLEWFFGTLMSAPTRVDAVLHEEVRREVPWSWPLRIGVLADDHLLGPLARLDQHHWSGQLFQLFPVSEGDRADLVVALGELQTAVPALIAKQVEASAVLFVNSGRSSGTTRLLRAALHASGALLAGQQRDVAEPSTWLRDVIAELSHTWPLHSVLVTASQFLASPAPLIVMDRRRALALNLATGSEDVLRRMRSLRERRRAAGLPQASQHVELSPRLEADLGVRSGSDFASLERGFRSARETLTFEREIEGATTIAEATAAVAAAEEETTIEIEMAATDDIAPSDRAAAAAREGRYRVLRARLREGDSGPTVANRPVAPDSAYAIEVSIGPPEAEWLLGAAPFVAPDEPPDDPVRGWRLRVVVWDPSYLPEPVERALWLRQSGATDTVNVPLRTGSEAVPVAARIIVLHRNLVLQTGVLRTAGEVDEPVSFTLDAAPVPVLDQLRSDRWFSASLVINHDGQGDPRATVVSDNEIGLVALRPDTIDEFAERVSKILSDTAKEPDSYRPVEGEASRKLLAELARRGSGFYEQLIHDTPVLADRLRSAPRIQIVAATSDSWLPAELLYRFTPPGNGATVCVPGVAALTDPDPGADCGADHDENVVCPMGFWSLCKVTERHAHIVADTDLRHPFALYDAREFPIAPVLRPLQRALLGASNLTDEVDTHASEKLMEETDELTTVSEQAGSWDQWKDQIKDLEPSLLVLLPHHWKEGSAEGLEISGDRLDAALILDPVVRAAGSEESPVVLLMGCKTTATRVAFDSFVQKFRRHGAAVVVSTYATVLGRQVAPVTARLLKELSGRMSHGDARMGDALLTIRRQLVAEGMPLGLSLTAYGDADCRLRGT